MKHQLMVIHEHETEDRGNATVFLMARCANNGDTRARAQLLLLKNQHVKVPGTSLTSMKSNLLLLKD